MLHIPSHVRIGKTPDVLFQIREAGVNLAVWEREFSLPLLEEIQKVSVQESFRRACRSFTDVNAPFPKVGITEDVDAEFEIRRNIGFILHADQIGLTEDQIELFHLFKTIFPEAREFSYETRIEAGKRLPAKKFHIDNPDSYSSVYRLTTSYLEEGSEWLADGPHKIDENGWAEPADDSYRHKTDRGAVLILKGGAGGLYHEAPGIPDGTNRIVNLMGCEI